jgi:hypothetical protein
MAELPNLAGVATSDLVEKIGSGRFEAKYINWSRTMHLLHVHAPGWMVDFEPTQDGQMVHPSPGVGGKILIRFRHLDGTVTTSVPQAVMDNRNNSIPLEKMTSRDETDTHRRGACMASAMIFGLAYELWAKMPLENGYQVATEEEIQQKKLETGKTQNSSGGQATAEAAKGSNPQKADFIKAASQMGICEQGIQGLLETIGTQYGVGIKTLGTKDEKWVKTLNSKYSSQVAESKATSTSEVPAEAY